MSRKTASGRPMAVYGMISAQRVSVMARSVKSVRLGDEVRLQRQQQPEREEAHRERAAPEPEAAEGVGRRGADDEDERHRGPRDDGAVERVLAEVADLPGLDPPRRGRSTRGSANGDEKMAWFGLEARQHHPDHREEEDDREERRARCRRASRETTRAVGARRRGRTRLAVTVIAVGRPRRAATAPGAAPGAARRRCPRRRRPRSGARPWPSHSPRRRCGRRS